MSNRDLIIRKQNLVHDIYSNTRKQNESIDNVNEKELNQLIDHREILINSVLSIQNQISSIELSEDEKAMMNTVDDEIRLIQTLEKENYAAIELLKKRIQDDIKENSESMKKISMSNKAIASGYLKQYDQSQGYYVDSKK